MRRTGPVRSAANLLVRLGVFALGLGAFGRTRTHAAELPHGFLEEKVADGINAATAMAVARDGRIFVCEQTGRLLVVKNHRLLPEPFLTLAVDDYWERGLIGVTLHPAFPATPYVYVVYVSAAPWPHHRISRFTAAGDRALPGSEKILLEGDDQRRLGGSVPAGHQGGPIRFGPDGKIYVALGEQTAGAPSQRLNTFQGKILRIDPEGGIPRDNPFYEVAKGKYRAIWAYGLRNPFGLAFQPGTGRLFENDVGQSSWEEINEIVRGGNYGWPEAEGTSKDSRFKNPLHTYPPVIGRSITGGVFYDPAYCQFPTQYVGQYFFLDYMAHWLKVLNPEHPESVSIFAKNFNGPVDVQVAPEGSLYVLNRAAWVRDNKTFVANSGSLLRIYYAGTGSGPVPEDRNLPRRLSQTGLFVRLQDLAPVRGLRAFELNAPVWLPGVKARRWMRLPLGKRIRFSPDEPWRLPEGAVVIQHFDAMDPKNPSAPGIPFETRVYWAGPANCFQAAAYRWRKDGQEADLVEDGEVVTQPGRSNLSWFSPGAETCWNPASATVGFILQLNTRQLNRGIRDGATGRTVNQIRRWMEAGWVAPILDESSLENLPQLAAWDEPGASAEKRVRSYLDANCAFCHYPGGPSRGYFDARYQTPLENQKLIRGELMSGDLGLAGAKVITPGNLEKSILWQRLRRTDFFRMPPVAVNSLPPPILPALEEWIRGMNLKPGTVSKRIRPSVSASRPGSGAKGGFK
jgi:glucose/arabinose dehydrogenase